MANFTNDELIQIYFSNDMLLNDETEVPTLNSTQFLFTNESTPTLSTKNAESNITYCQNGSYYETTIEYLRSSDPIDANNSTKYMRQWLYLLCTQIGYFTTSNSKNQPFGDLFPLEYISKIFSCIFWYSIITRFCFSFFVKKCQDVFSEDFDLQFINRQIAKTNSIYGGLNFQGTRVVFLNGDLDPW